MKQILIHSEPLSPEKEEELTASGIITIPTENVEGFRFLDVEASTINTNDMVWACLDAMSNEGTLGDGVRKKFITNLRAAAERERRQRLEREDVRQTVGMKVDPIEVIDK